MVEAKNLIIRQFEKETTHPFTSFMTEMSKWDVTKKNIDDFSAAFSKFSQEALKKKAEDGKGSALAKVNNASQDSKKSNGKTKGKSKRGDRKGDKNRNDEESPRFNPYKKPQSKSANKSESSRG
ncbi:hypothetical protein HDU97_009763, partial [Phlyctochytrium planicorne]